MSQALATAIREAYAAFGRGDVDGYLKACSDDFRFNVPGHRGISGVYPGKAGIYELARKAMTITGTFSEDVEEVPANEHHGIK